MALAIAERGAHLLEQGRDGGNVLPARTQARQVDLAGFQNDLKIEQVADELARRYEDTSVMETGTLCQSNALQFGDRLPDRRSADRQLLCDAFFSQSRDRLLRPSLLGDRTKFRKPGPVVSLRYTLSGRL